MSPYLQRLRFDNGPPPPPKKKLAKKWLPLPFAILYKLLVYPFAMMDLSIQRLIAFIFPPPVLQVGSCKKRGHCCYYILMPRYQNPLLRFLLSIWSTQIHGFFSRQEIVEDDKGKKWEVMGCRYLKSDGSCGQYTLRPLICRKWPLIQGFSQPSFLKGCGYKPLIRDPKLIKKWQQNPFS